MAGESSRRHLFVAIDRAAPRVFIRVFKAKTAANARRFLRGLERACPMRIRTVLTDNGRKFTDRLFGPRNRAATGEHEGDTLCTALGTEHRLIRGFARSGLKSARRTDFRAPFTPDRVVDPEPDEPPKQQALIHLLHQRSCRAASTPPA